LKPKKTKVNQLKAGVALSYISMAVGNVIAIIYTPIMLRILGQSEFGLYNLVASIVSYLGLFSFGFGSAYMRYYSRYKVKNDDENIAKLNGMFLIIFTVIGFIAVAAGTVLVFNVDILLGDKLTVSELAKAKILMAIMVLNIAISFPTTVFNSQITANEKYVFQVTLQMVKTILNPFIILPILLMGYKSIGMAAAATALSFIVEVTNVVYCFRKLKIKFRFRNFDFVLMKEMTVFSSFLFVNMVIDQANWNVDKFIIGRFRGTIAVAVYGLASQLNMYYLSLSSVISNVFIPRVNRMIAGENDNKELTGLFTRVGRVQFIILSLIGSGLVFFGRPFIYMWAGSDYSEAYPIALLLIIPVTIPLIQNLGIEIQKAKNMHKFRSLIYLFVAVANVCMSIPLTQLYGGVGAALGTAIALLLGNGIIMNWYYHNRIGLDIKYFWSHILRFVPALIPPIGAGITINLLVNLYHPIPFVICGIIYVIIFCVSIWFLGMNQYEKNLIGRPILKVLVKLKICRG